MIPLIDGATTLTPLFQDGSRKYLPDVYTFEADVWGLDDDDEDILAYYDFSFLDEEDERYRMEITFRGEEADFFGAWQNGSTGEGADARSDNPAYFKRGDWNHVALSFNKRALKMYINGIRVANAPNAKRAEYLKLFNGWDETKGYVKNVRLAKGAVPLYDRLATDGKIISYAITFATGKADLKPESMVEITRIAKLMKDNPDLKFEVQGHCDSTGSDAVNDPLSQKRAEAIVAALVKEGIASSRLTAVGKGAHSPLADNSTEEGRAKNRRVEFVKK